MDTRADEEEAPTDPAARKHTHHDYTEQDFEGHRAHTVFVGVHVPARRHSHRKHKHHHRNGGKDPEKPSPAIMARVRRLSVTDDGETLTPPAQRVQFILGEDVDDTTLESHPLFSEMEELVRDGDELEWKETARWIKFEEDVEEGGNRWSKPHVATLSLHSLFELRSLILNGSVILDLEANSLEQVAENVLDNMIVEGGLAYDRREKVKDALLRRHRHQYEKRNHNNMSRLPLIRSLADIGKNHSSCKNFQDGGSRRSSSRSCRGSTSSPNTALLRAADARGSYLAVPGAAPDEGMIKSPSSLSMHRNHSSGDLPMNGDVNHKSNTHFMRKIPPGAEASNILVGEVDFLEKTLSAFVRLKTGTIMGDLTEVPVPTRFMFVLLGPPNSNSSFHEIGRAMATLMSDEIFHEVAYRAKKRDHLLAGIDEFLDAVTVLPPGEWDPSIRIEPPAAIPSQDPRKRPTDNNLKEEPDEEEEEQRQREESGLARSGKLFGGLINDLKRKIPWYWSDFKDALALQCIASWIFLYFACLSPIITFGGLLGEATGKNMAAMESLVSGFVCGMGYGFFSGQPLTILGSTGPVLVFETIVFEFCKQIGWNYMSFRFCIGTWTTIILIILVAIDASALVCYITRFTEENFATLIAFIFIYKAVENVISIGKKNPIKTRPDEVLNYECYCLPGNYSRVPEQFNWTSVDKESCQLYNGTLAGGGCDTKVYVPDVFLMSIILFLGTFTISIILKDFKNSLFFPSKVRQIISDFSVIIAILSMSFLDFKVGIKTPKLEVPSEFKPTLPTREWVITPFNGNPVWSALVAILPALLGTILIFMDQQITAVIVNRKENKLKKGCGYHLDLFILAILIQICSIMGLPWFVAATVLSINHVNSLKVESECAAPGEKPQFLGVREQRVTHILIFLTIGCSVVLTPVLRHIPMPVLFGVFLYMGVASLKGLQFFDRILIMFMPQKYQPDHMFLRQVPIRRVHVFTAIQLTCLVCLWVIKSFSMTSILFPLMLVVMIGIRKSLDIFFTRREMKILDDVMPEMTKRNQDELRELADVEDTNKSNPPAFQENLQIPLINGNIMNIPLASINISEEVNKTGIWKQVNNSNKAKARLESKELKAKSGKKTIKHKKLISKNAQSEIERRLSTMDEVEEDDPSMKSDLLRRKDSWSSGFKKNTSAETSV
ncbi:electroneutral sodium bicarbonate exchanger 1 isoform X1 [Nymphalis io]|uniref:electroneutral sodium bicarbonate exchanger 1 isoform X1 n=1 Tax=Inachis io TaxID=171585 RepID=UPI00216A4C14|nr:electroneutral sodium bicarbonate exchanger 1 isoform X1 [Nymphalis io]XP_050362140.1 electroneutral sodium bicarbonate exchanger 1 isoform X1 [Nymphalis io]XP_050362141.1 electroneutral sodium bicarbonate exchanger 1 isoform X1 [Nymphalis io]